MKKSIIIFLVTTILAFYGNAQIQLDSTITYIKQGANINVKPGDTIFLLGGNRPYLMFENICGKPDSIITIINKNGQVIINTSHYFGISFKNCQYFKLTGTGNPTQNFGIHIKKVENGGGLSIGALSNNAEIDHLKIENTKLAGIYCKTDPDTTFRSSRDSFLMQDIYIHHNYIGKTGDEGMYVGSTKYFGQIIQYHGVDTLVLPHLLENIDISYNEIRETGWDGIQLSSAHKNAKIHHNHIYSDSRRASFNQMSGIILGGGTKADCFNNFIADGIGTGILVMSLGGQKIFNNIILNSGKDFMPSDPMEMEHGIYVGDVSTEIDSSFFIFNNLIIKPKSDGIRFTSLKSKNNLIFNNAIIEPGNYWFYDTLHTSFTADDSYIMISDTYISAKIINNFKSLSIDSAIFTDTLNYNFAPLPGSPLIDAGWDTLINVDFYNHPRPIGNSTDIGPIEFHPNMVSVAENSALKMKVYPNPSSSYIIIELDGYKPEYPQFLIYDLGGKLIKSGYSIKGCGGKLHFDVEDLKPGVYVLKLESNTINSTAPFIINK